MKKARTLLSIVLAAALCFMMSFPAFAATTSQSGFDVTLTTDKEEYAQDEKVEITLVVKNTNDLAAEMVSLETLIPEGFELAPDSEKESKLESLAVGEETTLKTVIQREGLSAKGAGSLWDKLFGTTAGKIGLLVSVIAVIIIIVVIIIAVKKKKTKSVVSLILCAAILSSLLPSTLMRASASADVKIEISQDVTVDKKSLTVKSLVSYANLEGAKDTDDDRLYDEEEKDYGTDPLNPDTDDDGLTDYEEIVLGLNPLEKDEFDENTDSDSDEITDLDEIRKYDTSRLLDDTDRDDLSDYDEIFVQKTDPLNPDTDGDTLTDGFEVKNGLDPNNKCTDGKTEDSSVKISQTTTDDAISMKLSDKDNLAKPAVSGKKAGEIDKNVFLSSSGDSAFNENRAVVGKAVDVVGEDSYVKGLTLTFDLSSYEGDLKQLSVAKFNDDGLFEVVDSKVNSKKISASLNKSGTYCVINIKEYLSSFGINIDEIIEGKEATAEFVVKKEKKKEPGKISGHADIVFAIDTTGSMRSAINNVVRNVTAFVNVLSKNYNVKVNFALIDYKDITVDGSDSTRVVKNGSSKWFSSVSDFSDKVNSLDAIGGGDDPETSVDALETARRLDFRSSASKFIILITDEEYKIDNNYGIKSMQDEIKKLKNDGIITSVVSYEVNREIYKDLYETTGGVFVDISDSNFADSLIKLAELIGEETSKGKWVILKHGLKPVHILDGVKDQDKDGVPTNKELGKKTEANIFYLVRAVLKNKGIDVSKYKDFGKIEIYDAISDPTKDDTDNDGILDNKDDAPWTEGLKGGIIGKMSLVATKGDKVYKIVWDYLTKYGVNTGHSFITYKSYVKDNLDLSKWNGGYKSKDGTWVEPIAQEEPTKNLEIAPDSCLTFSAGGDDKIEIGCAIYNMEMAKHWNPPCNYSYKPNKYIEQEITRSSFEKAMKVMEEEAKIEYDVASHNCTHVALNVWNTVFGTKIDPLAMNTPTNLYSWLNKHKGNTDFNLDDFYKYKKIS